MSVITGQGVTAYPLPDEELSPTSKNAVSNEAVCEGLDEIKNTLSHKADLIYDTASGDIASFPDGADGLPVKDLTIAIEPVQDLHGYDYPWPGGGNVNMIPDGTDTGNGYVNNAYIRIDGTFDTNQQSSWYVSEYFPVTENTAYTMSFNRPTIPTAPAVCFYDANKNYIDGTGFNSISPKYITSPNGAAYARCSQYKSDGYLIQFELGSTATTIRPYSNICPISGRTGANITRAGKNLLEQTVREYRSETLDANINADSVFIIRADSKNQGLRLKLCPDNMNALPAGTYTLSSDSNDVYVTITSSGTTAKTMTVVSDGTFVFDNIRMFVRPNTALSNVTVHFMLVRVSDIFAVTIPFHDSQGDPLTVYAASLDALAGSLKVRPYYPSYNGETLVGPWISSIDAYTPGGTPTTGAQVVDLGGAETEYTIDPVTISTLIGQNNVWADCGPSTVEYPCDTKLYIQKINTPTDDDMIADAQIASGKYFIVNNNLYLSTTTILAGDPIKPGTNCTLTNLAAALNAINS